jgi:hypothetical protein
MLLKIHEFRENLRREGRAVLMAVVEVTSTGLPWNRMMFNVKNALIKSVYTIPLFYVPFL